MDYPFLSGIRLFTQSVIIFLWMIIHLKKIFKKSLYISKKSDYPKHFNTLYDIINL